jgi:hypothetical protein
LLLLCGICYRLRISDVLHQGERHQRPERASWKADLARGKSLSIEHHLSAIQRALAVINLGLHTKLPLALYCVCMTAAAHISRRNICMTLLENVCAPQSNEGRSWAPFLKINTPPCFSASFDRIIKHVGELLHTIHV